MFHQWSEVTTTISRDKYARFIIFGLVNEVKGTKLRHSRTHLASPDCVTVFF